VATAHSAENPPAHIDLPVWTSAVDAQLQGVQRRLRGGDGGEGLASTEHKTVSEILQLGKRLVVLLHPDLVTTFLVGEVRAVDVDARDNTP
jgi:hypothetical protein